MELDATTLTALIAGVVLLAIAIAFSTSRKRSRQRSAALRENFGPEYDRALEQHGDPARAERELIARKKRLDELDIKLLSDEQCDKFSSAWGVVQQLFVDDPNGATVQADSLVKEVMRTRGYPIGDFEQRAADLSVEHGRVVQHYRAAQNIATANTNGQAGTEDLRQAMVHYRALFNDLLQAEPHRAALTQARV
jgi:cbb3-type cytochrome oxidase subunit 3